MKGLRLLCERNYRLIYKTNLGFTAVFMSVDHGRDVTRMQHETYFCYGTSLQGFGYGDVVHEFEKHCQSRWGEEERRDLKSIFIRTYLGSA